MATPPALVQEDLDKGRIVGICEKVDDGDTIFVNGKEVRLVGIDSKEKGTFLRRHYGYQAHGGTASRKDGNGIFRPPYPSGDVPPSPGRGLLGRWRSRSSVSQVRLERIFVNYILVNECLAEPNDKGRNQYIDPEMFKGAWQKCKLADFPDQVRLTIKTKSTHARIYVDGVDSNKVTPGFVDVTPGTHHITLAADGCSAWHEDITVDMVTTRYSEHWPRYQ